MSYERESVRKGESVCWRGRGRGLSAVTDRHSALDGGFPVTSPRATEACTEFGANLLCMVLVPDRAGIVVTGAAATLGCGLFCSALAFDGILALGGLLAFCVALFCDALEVRTGVAATDGHSAGDGGFPVAVPVHVAASANARADLLCVGVVPDRACVDVDGLGLVAEKDDGCECDAE